MDYWYEDEWYVGSDLVDPNNLDPKYDEPPPKPPGADDDPNEPEPGS